MTEIPAHDPPCAQCGAPQGAPDCRARFERLLALDHSRREPWGPRHALAVAVYTLQHPEGNRPHALERCWLIAYRCVVLGDDPWNLARGLARAREPVLSEWGVPPPSPPPVPGAYRLTIADLGSFDAETYPRELLAWARATVERWSGG